MNQILTKPYQLEPMIKPVGKSEIKSSPKETKTFEHIEDKNSLKLLEKYKASALKNLNSPNIKEEIELIHPNYQESITKAKNNSEINREKNPDIELILIESKTNLNGKKYIITPNSFNSASTINPSLITYLGIENLSGHTNCISNDPEIILPYQEGLSSKHFYIRFDKISNKYYLKDNYSAEGTFYKIIKPYVLIN